MSLFGKGRGAGQAGTRLFFATDVHGSDKCFHKFINAGKFYGAQYIVLGGDITGKTLVPIRRTERGWSARYFGRSYEDMTENEKRQLEQQIRDNGQYPVIGEQDELDALDDEAELERQFRTVVVEHIRRWVEFADERLRGTGVRCFITPGNDDFWDIDEVLQESDLVEFVEGRCVRLDDTYEMITTGISNVTPWDSPRELEEEELAKYIDRMFDEVEDPETVIAVLHAPPLRTTLDEAPEIDSDFRVRTGAGGMRMTHVGSAAVREFIELHQPLVGLHGHVHESRAAQRLGRTLCINPGSEYTDGVLAGALVSLGNGEVSHQFVAG